MYHAILPGYCLLPSQIASLFKSHQFATINKMRFEFTASNTTLNPGPLSPSAQFTLPKMIYFIISVAKNKITAHYGGLMFNDTNLSRPFNLNWRFNAILLQYYIKTSWVIHLRGNCTVTCFIISQVPKLKFHFLLGKPASDWSGIDKHEHECTVVVIFWAMQYLQIILIIVSLPLTGNR